MLTGSNTLPWVFFTYFKLYKWYKIGKSVTIRLFSSKGQKIHTSSPHSRFSFWTKRAGDLFFGKESPMIFKFQKLYNYFAFLHYQQKYLKISAFFQKNIHTLTYISGKYELAVKFEWFNINEWLQLLIRWIIFL